MPDTAKKPNNRQASYKGGYPRAQRTAAASPMRMPALPVQPVKRRKTGFLARILKRDGITRERLAKFDYPFFIIVIVLLVFGIIMMFSASYAYAYRMFGDSYYYISPQLNFIIIGVIAMIFISFLDYHIMLNKIILTIGLSVSAVLMLWVMLNGVTQGGAERWIDMFGIRFQPSEITKFAVIMTFAYFAHKRAKKIKELKLGFMPFAVCLTVSCGLTLLQPHLSGTIIIFLIGIVMMFVGSCRLKHIILYTVIFIIVGILGLLFLRYAMGIDYFGDRITSWLDPEADIRNVTMQTYQSLVTIGSGGVFGLGLGNSRQKYSYLPASHNDFIFSIICEELGFVGAMLIILLFVLFIFRGFYIASKARDRFGMLLAVGITAQIGIQALLNIGVVTNSIPNTGISLPFFSYGGTALLMQLAEIGVVLNISRKAAT